MIYTVPGSKGRDTLSGTLNNIRCARAAGAGEKIRNTEYYISCRGHRGSRLNQEHRITYIVLRSNSRRSNQDYRITYIVLGLKGRDTFSGI